MLRVLMESIPQLLVTSDQSNTTSLYTAAAQGHVEVVNFLLEKNSGLATITRNNGKTVLHSSARNGHFNVVKALLSKEPGILDWNDKKGQTALHMAVKGQSLEVVDELLLSNAALISMVDGKGNTALHIATRKGRIQIVQALLNHKGLETNTINKSGETAFDTAEKNGHSDIAIMLQEHGVQSAKYVKPPPQTTSARGLKQTVSDIRHEVHNQLEHSCQTRKRVQDITKRINKMHEEGLNNAKNSTTIVAVLIATVAFAAIFTLPVVVVQTTVVVVERKAKKKLMAIINKLMWLACSFVSVAYLALCHIIAGDGGRWLAIGLTVLGSVIMASTMGTLCYLVIIRQIEAAKMRSLRRRSARSSKSQSWSVSVMSDSEILDNECKKFYAI